MKIQGGRKSPHYHQREAQAMTTRSCPVMFPMNDDLYDIDALCAELAEMEAEPGTEQYEDSLSFYGTMTDWELIGHYRDRVA